MAKHDPQQAPKGRTRPAQGGEETFASEEGARADLEKPLTERTTTEPPSDLNSGGQQISGPGSKDLTRGLP